MWIFPHDCGYDGPSYIFLITCSHTQSLVSSSTSPPPEGATAVTRASQIVQMCSDCWPSPRPTRPHSPRPTRPRRARLWRQHQSLLLSESPPSVFFSLSFSVSFFFSVSVFFSVSACSRLLRLPSLARDGGVFDQPRQLVDHLGVIDPTAASEATHCTCYAKRDGEEEGRRERRCKAVQHNILCCTTERRSGITRPPLRCRRAPRRPPTAAAAPPAGGTVLLENLVSIAVNLA